MPQPKSSAQAPGRPLVGASPASTDVLDWQEVDRQDVDLAKDVLGLSSQDRQALGLSAPRAFDLQAPTLGGAETALADVLARGGAISRTDFRRKR